MNASKPPTPDEVRVLIVDDEGRAPRCSDPRDRFLGLSGCLRALRRGALRLMHASKFDVSIVDLNLPGISGIELFDKLRAIHPEHQVIVLTGFGNLEAARAAIRLDVVDFLEKPCPLGELEKSLHRATQRAGPPDTSTDPGFRTGDAAAGRGSDARRCRARAHYLRASPQPRQPHRHRAGTGHQPPNLAVQAQRISAAGIRGG